MKHTKRNVYALLPGLVLASLLVISSCSKDDDPVDAGGTKLSKVVTRHGDSTEVKYLRYDNEGRLKEAATEYHGLLYFKTFFYYDAEGKIVKTVQESPGSPMSGSQTDSFVYVNGRITTVLSLSNQAFRRKYIYDARGNLVSDSTFAPSATQPHWYEKYVYDVNDNLVEWQSFYYFNSGWQSSGAFRATHNTSLNPFGDLRFIRGITGPGLGNESASFSKHLVEHVIHPGGEVEDYNYEYYSNGLPRIAHVTSSWGMGTVEFFYE